MPTAGDAGTIPRMTPKRKSFERSDAMRFLITGLPRSSNPVQQEHHVPGRDRLRFPPAPLRNDFSIEDSLVLGATSLFLESVTFQIFLDEIDDGLS
jgi:hypothetical protein